MNVNNISKKKSQKKTFSSFLQLSPTFFSSNFQFPFESNMQRKLSYKIVCLTIDWRQKIELYHAFYSVLCFPMFSQMWIIAPYINHHTQLKLRIVNTQDWTFRKAWIKLNSPHHAFYYTSADQLILQNVNLFIIASCPSDHLQLWSRTNWPGAENCLLVNLSCQMWNSV